MPDLLLELRSEEIPARMQRKAAGDLRKLVTDGLVEAGLSYEGAREYWTPRRLTLDVRGVDARSRDVREEKKGPRTDAPAKAIEGFLRGAGLASIEQAETRTDPKKGAFYVAVVEKPGRPAEAIVAEILPGIVRNFPWPKSMRWGRASREPGSLRWVRPLQSILCTFGPETEEPVVVDFEVGGIRSGNRTWGHRFHAPGPITARRFDDYAASLEKAFVVLDAERRKEIIRHDAENLAFAQGLEVVPDEALLEEVAGLVEWPVTLMGSFEAEFLQIPPEVVRLTIKANQKCFVTRASRPASPTPQHEEHSADPNCHPEARVQRASKGEGAPLSNDFILVSNIEASDGGAEIARGNGKVVRARLSDALYFWQTDQADLPDLDSLRPSAEKFGLDLGKPLDQRMAKLDALGVTFHAKLGTQGERVQRIARLAEEIARTAYPNGASLGGETVSADQLAALARRAAVLAKADLTTEAVGEFPELQGLMGRYYAALQGEHPSVGAAIEEHYKPQGPSDAVPSDPVAVAVALADKLDTLVGFWAIDEKPTGSKDPYALRRAALGVIRVVLEAGLTCSLSALVHASNVGFIQSFEGLHALRFRSSTGSFRMPTSQLFADAAEKEAFWWVSLADLTRREWDTRVKDDIFDEKAFARFLEEVEIAPSLLFFFHDRLKVQLREQGARHDLVDAVLSGATPTSPWWGGRGEAAGGGDAAASSGISATPATPPRDPVDRDPPHRGEGGALGSGGAPNDDLLDITRRVEALGAFLDTEDGRNLLAGYRRAANILAAEEKKGTRIAEGVDLDLLAEPEEKALAGAIDRAEVELEDALQTESYAHAMTALAKLRVPVDAFFDKVLVNAEDEALRANRLALLARIRAATRKVADFSRIGG